MKGNRARWLFAVCCLIAAAAVVQDVRFDAAARQARISSASIDREATALRVKIAELRGGQTAYLATGQGPEFWMRRVTDLAAEIESGIGRLRSELRTTAAQSQLTAADSALAELVALDKRARQAINGEQRFLAADIIFAEGLTPAQALTDAVSSAAEADVAAIDAAQATEGRIRLAMMPAALLLVIGAGLTWAASKPKETPASAAASMAQMLRDLPPPVRSPGAAPAQPVRPVPIPPTISAAELTEAAELCVDLARILSPDDVRLLLGRAAGVLGASGIVLWVSNSTGDGLTAALWHGYSDRVISKMGPLDGGGDNITAVCFRTKRAQWIPGVGQPGGTSAIAVPLLNSHGCHGVLAAELTAVKPAAEGVALARIIAAQLGAMVAPADEAAGGAAAVG